MKKIALLISTILIVISCNRKKDSFEVDILPNGNVKEICKYKANYLDNDGKTTEKFRIISKTIYSNSKLILEQTHYDNNGKINHYKRNTFNDEDLNTYSISEDIMSNSKSIETKRYNSNGKIEKLSSTFDDSTNVIMLLDYDSLENIKRTIQILGNDTSINTFEYTYNSQNKIILKKEIQHYDNDLSIRTTSYKYNEDGEIIESTLMADFLMEPQIRTSHYSKCGRLVSVTTGSEKTIERTTHFDRYKSPIRVLNYRDNKLYNEFRNEYKYDKYHNWTSNRVLIKEHFTDINDFIPIYEEKRDITYY